MNGTNGTNRPKIMRLRDIVRALLGVAALCVLGPWSSAQTAPNKEIVADVFVFGNRTIPTSKIMNYIYTKPGSTYSSGQVQDDVQRLAAARLFKRIGDVRTEKTT